MKRTLAWVVGVVLWGATAAVFADDVILEQIYGAGVHAFNAGDYVGAHTALTQAIKGGTNDPRAYYFRGLAYLRLGREDEARADFQKGAELESGESADVYPVSRSLERIQGVPRQMLEQYRMGVQAVAVQRREAVRRARYDERVRAERDVLRTVRPNELPAAPPTTPAQEATSPAENPFAVPSKGAPAAGGPTAPAANPFEPSGPAQPEANPFEAAPPKAAPIQPEATPIPPAQIQPAQPATPITPEANPFGEQPAANPFGDQPAAKPGPDAMPAPKTPTPPATNDSPFGDAAPTPMPGTNTAPTAPPMTNPTPPAAAADPFGNAPATAPPAAALGGAPPVPGDATTGAVVAPTPGGVGGLFRAITKGNQTPPPAGAAPPSPPPILGMIKGFMGGGASPAPGPTNAPPPGDDPFSDAPPAAAPGNMAAPPANKVPAPAQAPPMPAPANNDDPFK